MPKGKPYTVYVENAQGLKPGTKVTVMGEGTVQEDGMVLVEAFESEGGPNAADVQMESMMGDAGQKEMAGLGGKAEEDY